MTLARSALAASPACAAIAQARATYDVVDIGPAPGDAVAKVNNRSQVVFSCESGGQVRAFLWDDGSVTDLGTPANGPTVGSDINGGTLLRNMTTVAAREGGLRRSAR